jgi:ligand-binding sensor domain-containing protein/DNA-binding CsgD family transcriptional regulator
MDHFVFPATHRKLIGFILALWLPAMIPAFAQAPPEGIPYIRHYSRQDYGSSPFNWSIVQDRRGVVYVANNYNLLQFDGNTWRSTPLPNRTVVRSLALDKNGTVYYGGQADFGYLQPDAHGEPTFVSLRSRIKPAEQAFADVWKILVTEQGVIFCTTAGLYTWQHDSIQFFRLDPEAAGLTSYFYVSRRLFVCRQRQGIAEFKDQDLVTVPHSEAVARHNITGMLPAPGNRILLATQQHGLFMYDGYSGFTPWSPESTPFFRNNTVVCAAAVPGGYILGSSHHGMLLLSDDGTPRLHLHRDNGLQHNGIEYIYPDNNGNVWLALRDGIDYVEINSPFTRLSTASGLAGAGFTSWVEGNIFYAGTSEGLYYKPWTPDNNPLTPSPFRLVEGTAGQTYNLQKIGNTLLLTHNNGVYTVQGPTAQRCEGPTGAWLMQPLAKRPGYLLCGAYDGLRLYQMIGDQPTFRWKIRGFDESSRVIEQDAAGNLWVAHGYLGLYRITLTDDLRQVRDVQFYNARNGFPSNVFINVFQVNHELIFTGQRGIYSYDAGRDTFIPHAALVEALGAEGHTRKLVEDREGNIWFASGDDLGILRKRNGQHYESTRTIFNKLQRRLVGGFEHIAPYSARHVIIGTDDGFVHFDPGFVFDTDHTFTTLIRGVTITAGGDSLLSGGVYADATAASPGDTPALPNTRNALRFSFSATSYEDPEHVQYQYRLEGYDAQWSPWTKHTVQAYADLPEGRYTFHVKSQDLYHRAGSEAVYTFIILPPWYRSYWAYAGYLVVSALLLQWGYRSVQRSRQKALRLQEATHQEAVLRAEKEVIKLNHEKLEHTLAHKNQELASSAMHIVHSFETLQKVKSDLYAALEAVQDPEARNHLKKILRAIAGELTVENRWEQFEHHFNQIHQDFLARLRREYPGLTHNDIKLISYLKLNLATKEIAPLLNLTVRGVEASRYRIRKKMNLDPHINLTDFILRY